MQAPRLATALLLLAPTAAQANFPGEIDGPPRAAFPDYSADGRTLAFVREAA